MKLKITPSTGNVFRDLGFRREEAEHRYLREVVEKQSTRTAWLPWQAQEPTGPDALALLASANLELSQY